MYGNYLGAYGDPLPQLRADRHPIMRHLLTVDGVEPSEKAVSRLLGPLPKRGTLQSQEMKMVRDLLYHEVGSFRTSS